MKLNYNINPQNKFNRNSLRWRNPVRAVTALNALIYGLTVESSKTLKNSAKYIYLLTHYCSGDKIEYNEMGGACSSDGEGRGVYRVLVVKPEGKRPLGKPRRRWEDNIKMDLQH
jgi:hypothetical protein